MSKSSAALAVFFIIHNYDNKFINMTIFEKKNSRISEVNFVSVVLNYKFDD